MNELTPTALLVEDEPQIRRFVRSALEEEGWQVFESATLARGLIDAGTRQPDLIVLDLGLPDGDGIDFIADVRKWSCRSSCCQRGCRNRKKSARLTPAPTIT
jgi:two-component system KDP operon response regulator KdpE